MRNIAIVLLVLLLFGIVCCPESLAVDNEYYITELDMGISIPDNYAVFTRDTSRDDENLLALGIDHDALRKNMETNSIYLNACNMDLTLEFLVKMKSVGDGIADFDTCTDDELKEFGKSSENYTDEQVTYYDLDVYQHTQTKFLRLYAADSSTGTDKPFIRYATVISGRFITIEFISYTGTFTTDQEEFSEDIMSSVVFNQQSQELSELPKESLQEETPPFLYEDPLTGVSFTVPANWREVEFSNEPEFLSKKFENIFDSDMNIMFGSVDIWNTLSDAEKEDMPRSEANLSRLHDLIQEISESYPELKLTEVNYNNRTYLELDSSLDFTISGIQKSSYLVQLYYIENGFMYSFQVFGPNQDSARSTLDVLMESVTYPLYVPTETNDTPTIGSIHFLLLMLIFACALFIVPALIYRHNHKTHLDRKKAITFVVVNALVMGTVIGLLSAFGNGSFRLSDLIFLSIHALFTGLVNYAILTKKSKTNSVTEQEYVNQ